MIKKNFGLFDFIETTNWYEIYDFQKPIDYKLFLYFINGFESYFDQLDLNTIYNSYLGKKVEFKVGINLTGYNLDFLCEINFWIGEKHFCSIKRIPYNIFDQYNIPILNGTIINRLKNYYSKNKNIIFYYTKN